MKKQSPKNIYISKGEYQLRLRQLEKSLLQTLNDVKARILDVERIITALATLKKEAAEVTVQLNLLSKALCGTFFEA